ncbi:MAG: ATP-binding protein [Planctomycetota bacterium]|jgi:hypothetical protein
MSAHQDILERLRSALADQLKVRLVDCFDVDGESDGENGVPRRRPLAVLTETAEERLGAVVGHEVEVRAHGVLLDEMLGTLALFHICDRAGEAINGRRDIEQSIHDALHVRQILRQRARKPASHEKSSYSVELILVVEQKSASDKDAEDTLTEIAETLRGIMARSGFLHAIGVSVLHVDLEYDGGDDGLAIDPSELRRAFPWLLTDVRIWLREESPVGSQTQTEPFELQSIELQDFRVAGSRRWDPDGEHNASKRSDREERQRLHLIHGANGSGKSSFTEAIELALTDRIARVEFTQGRRPKYVDVLTNRQRRAASKPGGASSSSGSQVAAQVTLNVRSVDSEDDEHKMICRAGDGAWQSSNDVKDNPKLKDELWERLRGTQEKPRFQNAASFRLDQVFCDRIAGVAADERAEMFLDAFFPDGGQRIATQKQLRTDFEKAWDDLPEAARSDLRVERRNPTPPQAIAGLDEQFSSATTTKQLVMWSGLKGDLKKLVPGSLPSLKAHWPKELFSQFSRKQTEARRESLLSRLDDAFTATDRDARVLLNAIEPALRLLRSLDQWEARSEAVDGTIEEFAQTLNEWLEKHADWDLAEKGRQLVEARLLLEADEHGNQSEGLRGVASEPTAEGDVTLQSRLDELTASASRLDREREEAHRRVLEFRLADESPQSDSSDRPYLGSTELNSLDRVVAIRNDTTLSSIVRRAIESQSPEEAVVGIGESDAFTVQIGRPAGLSALIEHVEQLQKDLHSMVEQLETRESPFAQVPVKLNQLRDAAEACVNEGSHLVDELQHCLEGPLQKALNELLALMTPARWAYRDVISESDFEKRTNQLDFVLPAETNGEHTNVTSSGDDVGFSLVLNTAELNSFALALFLLCAPKLDNPLRLLVLDDPFQNMDELTVSTIGRAIGRLMRLWQNEGNGLELWNMLVLVHGEGTMNRLRSEIACSAAYLPWLQPRELDAQTDGEKTNRVNGFDRVEMEDSLLSRELDHPARQNLIEIVPPVASVMAPRPG